MTKGQQDRPASIAKSFPTYEGWQTTGQGELWSPSLMSLAERVNAVIQATRMMPKRLWLEGGLSPQIVSVTIGSSAMRRARRMTGLDL
jgi:hypothetical protein